MDGEWHVPHFEKMLYDQAQIIQAYADAYVITKDSFYSDIVNDIATYVERDLRHKVLFALLFHLFFKLYVKYSENRVICYSSSYNKQLFVLGSLNSECIKKYNIDT